MKLNNGRNNIFYYQWIYYYYIIYFYKDIENFAPSIEKGGNDDIRGNKVLVPIPVRFFSRNTNRFLLSFLGKNEFGDTLSYFLVVHSLYQWHFEFLKDFIVQIRILIYKSAILVFSYNFIEY